MKTLLPTLGICLTLLVSCGQQQTADLTHTPVVSVAPAFSPYVSKFQALSVQEGSAQTISDLSVQFGPISTTNEIGVCETGTNLTPSITVLQSTWEQMTESEQEVLMFHELGHCILNRVHVTSLNGDNSPTSIMYPYALDPTIYEANLAAYQAELFHP